MTRRPTSFDLNEVRFDPEDLYSQSELALEEGTAVALPARRRKAHWIGLLVSAVGGLIALWVGISVDNLVRDLFSRNDWLGWVGIALVAVAAIALAALTARELTALFRLRRVNHIHAEAIAASAADDREAALKTLTDLNRLYRHRPDTARGRAALAGHRKEIIDGRDLIALGERELLVDFDAAARRMVLSSAKRVAIVTAISPRALVDILFVGAEILRLIRRVATLYGGRPGVIGFWRLAQATITHLAVTGGIATGDSIIQQILGHGVAARLSARLGEGVVNGLLTARVGIAAVEVCRPLPFISGSPPRLGDVMAELSPLGKSGG